MNYQNFNLTNTLINPMKNLIKTLPQLLLLAIVIGSCENEEIVKTQELLSEEQTLAVVESETIEDELDNVIDDFFGAIEIEIGSKIETEDKSQGQREGLLSCVTKTVVLTATEKSVTLDFGEGCETPKEDVLKGIIKMDFEWNFAEGTVTILKSFEDFYFNDVLVEGSKTIIKTRSNANEVPESVVTFDMKLTWANGSFAERTGTRTRTFIEGFDTRPYADNVFSIVGNATTTLIDGTVISSEILEPLIRNMACRYIVSGVKTMIKEGKTYTLDFGDGECDNKATLTVDGETTEIELRKKRRK